MTTDRLQSGAGAVLPGRAFQIKGINLKRQPVSDCVQNLLSLRFNLVWLLFAAFDTYYSDSWYNLDSVLFLATQLNLVILKCGLIAGKSIQN